MNIHMKQQNKFAPNNPLVVFGWLVGWLVSWFGIQNKAVDSWSYSELQVDASSITLQFQIQEPIEFLALDFMYFSRTMCALWMAYCRLNTWATQRQTRCYAECSTSNHQASTNRQPLSTKHQTLHTHLQVWSVHRQWSACRSVRAWTGRSRCPAKWPENWCRRARHLAKEWAFLQSVYPYLYLNLHVIMCIQILNK